MRYLVLTVAGFGLAGFGVTLTAPPVWAGPTADQAAAESLEPATPGLPKDEAPSAAITNGQVDPTVIPGNGLAQDRIKADQASQQ